MKRLALIADDLTGALDSSAPFALRGLRTLVAPRPAALRECLEEDWEVLGVSTDSRELMPDAARQAVASCLEQLPERLALFKKVDSRLKGNVEAELSAFRFSRAFVSPAIPAFGRIVADGRLTGFGVEAPVDIARCLGTHAGRALIPDVASQAELEDALARAPDALPVGARGLAEALAKHLAPAGAAKASRLAPSRVIFVIGSRDPITLEQVAQLKAARAELAAVRLPADSGGEPRRMPIMLIEATGAAAAPAEVARELAGAVRRLGPEAGDVLVVSGGSTAQAVLGQLGVNALELIGEALPGLPIARAGKFNIITKSGGFGDRRALARLADLLGVETGDA